MEKHIKDQECGRRRLSKLQADEKSSFLKVSEWCLSTNIPLTGPSPHTHKTAKALCLHDE